ncbi:MAG: CBS domain-containing protein [Bdellovibrionia bacterium]
MKISELMTRHVETVEPEATLKDAAQLMDDEDVGALPVCDNDRLVGIITDRDIIVRAVSAGVDPNRSRVADSMTSPILYCYDDQDADEVRRMMQDKKVRRLPVLDRSRRMIGIVSNSDLELGHSEHDQIEKRAA